LLIGDNSVLFSRTSIGEFGEANRVALVVFLRGVNVGGHRSFYGFTIVLATDIIEVPAIAASSAGSLLVWLQTPQSTTTTQLQLMGLRIYPSSP